MTKVMEYPKDLEDQVRKAYDASQLAGSPRIVVCIYEGAVSGVYQMQGELPVPVDFISVDTDDITNVLESQCPICFEPLERNEDGSWICLEHEVQVTTDKGVLLDDVYLAYAYGNRVIW